MKIMKPITLGPFVSVTQREQFDCDSATSLGLMLEWAYPEEAFAIPLFCHSLPTRPNRLRFEQILFHHQDLPCETECQKHQVSFTPHGCFLPLNGLLLALYRQRAIERPIYALLNEFAAALPLNLDLGRHITSQKLLRAEAEATGFRLHKVITDSERVHAQIAWEAARRATRFHVATATFRRSSASGEMCGEWVQSGEAGVSRLLADELARLIPNSPDGLLTNLGFDLLQLGAESRGRLIT